MPVVGKVEEKYLPILLILIGLSLLFCSQYKIAIEGLSYLEMDTETFIKLSAKAIFYCPVSLGNILIDNFRLSPVFANPDVPTTSGETSAGQIQPKSVYLGNIKLNNFPKAIAVNPKTNMVYAIDSGDSSSLYIINGTKDKVERIIPIGLNAEAIAVNPTTNMIYVAADKLLGYSRAVYGSSNFSVPNVTPSIFVINGDTNDIEKVLPTSRVTGITVDVKTNTIYLIENNFNVITMNGKNNSIIRKPLTLSFGIWGLAINSNKNILYVPNFINNTVSVIDISKNKIVTNTTVPRPSGLAVNPATDTIYVANDIGNRVFVINGTTNKVTKTIMQNYTHISNPDTKIAVDYKTNLAYMITSSNVVYVIDGVTDRIIANLVTGRVTSDVAVNPMTSRIYVGLANDSISVIDGKKDSIMDEISKTSLHKRSVSGLIVGSKPSDIAVNPITNRIYVIDSVFNTVSIIDGDKDRVVGKITLRTSPSHIAINPNTNLIYVLDTGNNLLSVIDGNTNNIVANIIVSSSIDGIRNALDLAVNPNTNTIYIISGNPPESIVLPPININYSKSPPCLAYAHGQIQSRVLGGKDENTTDSLCAIDGNTNRVIGNVSIDSPNRGGDLAIDSNRNILYTINSNETITALSGINPSLSFRMPDCQTKAKVLCEPDITAVNYVSHMAVDPVTNMIYIIGDKGKSVYKLDSYTNTILSNLTLGGSLSDIAVNPITGIVYVTNSVTNSVNVINMTTNTLADIQVDNSPSSITLNSETNMIYVTNENSGTVSIIDGNIKKLIAGISFNVEPESSGDIYCNDVKISSNYTRFAVGTELTCIAKPVQSRFGLLDLNELIFHFFYSYNRIVFDSWSGTESSSSENPIHLTVSDYGGTLTAKFKEAPPPPNYTDSIIIPAVFIVIPALVALIYKRRPKGLLERFFKAIEIAAASKPTEESRNRLMHIREEITNQYARSKITEEQYEILDSKISYYLEKKNTDDD